MMPEPKMSDGLSFYGPSSYALPWAYKGVRCVKIVVGCLSRSSVAVRAALSIVSVLLLFGCVRAEQTNVRPGATSAIDQDNLTPPDGVRYEYIVQSNDPLFPEAAIRSMVSRKVSPNRYVYEGSVFLPLSPVAEVNEAFLAGMREFAGEDAVRVTGNKFVFGIEFETDRRYRTTRSNILFADINFMPHDCFAQLGTCRSTAQSILGDMTLVTETSEAGGIWRSVTRTTSGALKGMRKEVIYSIDPNGVLLDAEATETAPDGTVETTIMRRLEPRLEP